MAINYMLPLRIIQAILGLLVFAMAAFVANWYNTATLTPSPPQVNFLVFTGVWTLIVAVPYLALAPRFFAKAAHKYAMLTVEAVTMLFWFGGFVALAAFLGKLLFCRGNVCRAAQTATVFGAFDCVLFATTTTLAAIHCLRTRTAAVDARAVAAMHVEKVLAGQPKDVEKF